MKNKFLIYFLIIFTISFSSTLEDIVDKEYLEKLVQAVLKVNPSQQYIMGMKVLKQPFVFIEKFEEVKKNERE